MKAVGEDIEQLGFNKAVARLYELVNALAPPRRQVGRQRRCDADKAALREALEMLVSMIAPMMPHLAEECWAALGGEGWSPNQALAGIRRGA